MSDVKYPQVTVTLLDEDSNAFNLMSHVARVIRSEVGVVAGAEFLGDVQHCETYEDLLEHVRLTVNVG